MLGRVRSPYAQGGKQPDHSTAGAIEATRRFGSGPSQRLLGRLVAYAAAGHHAGLADGSGPSATSLDSRLDKVVPACPGWEAEATGLPDRLTAALPVKGGARDAAYSLAIFGRMLFSCLVDADFLATEAFYARHKGGRGSGRPCLARCGAGPARLRSRPVHDDRAEAQRLPVHLLRPCLAAMHELAASCGASVVLCTATQPALKREQDGFRDGLVIPDDRELAPEPARLHAQLRRVTVEHRGVVSDDEIAARSATSDRMLCIVNSRRHAQNLLARVADLPGARHLTTLMCPSTAEPCWRRRAPNSRRGAAPGSSAPA